jgi:FlaA1/EpsC-like NDP-sugar epimerase
LHNLLTKMNLISNLKLITENNAPRWVILVVDILLSFFSFTLALFILGVLHFEQYTFDSYLFSTITVVSIRWVGYWITKSYAGIVRYTSTQDAVRLFVAIALSTTGILIFDWIYLSIFNHLIINPSVIIIDSFILLVFLSSFRIGFKLLYNQYALQTFSGEKPKKIIIYGAGEAGIIVKRSFDRNYKLNRRVIAFLDDNPKLHNKSVEGVKIYSSDFDYTSLSSNPSNIEMIIAINNFRGIKKHEIIERCLQNNTIVKIMPPVSAWINGEFNPKNMKSVRIEDLLEREPIKLSKKKINSELRNQIILITGAAGSIGSEIARQCIHFSPKKIILLDQAETPLFNIQNELSKIQNVEIVVADVCNTARLERIFDHFKPSYVFHAAAYKHVPMMEDNPYEAINTNVFGTQNIANLSVKYKVNKFVFVSTDKAVNPSNIMGASKRIAEIYVQSLDAKLQLESDKHTRFVTTRFGNVLGSNGSVIPLFKKQIETGGPITVTHPEITRYFMTIPEACQLVLEAGVMGKGGEIYVFDMGESVKIVDLARKMVKLSGLVINKDIRIKFTGLRPGEKLKEELLNDLENTIGTHNPKIMIARVPNYNYLEVNKLISDLYQGKDNLKNSTLVKTMKKIVPEYISNNSVYEKLDIKFLK